MQNINEEILNGMAKAFFADAFATQGENLGISFSQMDIMDLIPDEMDPCALFAAKHLYKMFNRRMENQGFILHTEAFAWYVWQWGFEDLEQFGHYTAMQALGHGVGLFDFDTPSNIRDCVLSAESVMLSRLYHDAAENHKSILPYINLDGMLSAFAWPGGYPIYYLDAGSNILCATCAQQFLNDEREKPIARGIIGDPTDDTDCCVCHKFFMEQETL